jgi:DNA-binding MarR family transcriptional regulator/GNAT superfamily N-acetyltransferase
MGVYQLHTDILAVRDASRRIVRSLGFMRSTLANTDLSASAVHAVIEIGGRGELTANRLGQILLLEKSSVSRLLGRLIERDLVTETTSTRDGRAKILTLTEKGYDLLADIDHYANVGVGRAIRFLNGHDRSQVVEGLRIYAGALDVTHREAASEKTDDIEIVEGFRPGALGRIAEMHGRYYAREWEFPPLFEARVADGLADFVPRLVRDRNQIWLACRLGEIRGSVAIDGEDLGENKAHLRWLVVDDDLRGSGSGRRLLSKALDFCDEKGFTEVHLWTFKGLDAARKLYESAGFVLVEEWEGDQWGRLVTEQKFVRRIVHIA